MRSFEIGRAGSAVKPLTSPAMRPGMYELGRPSGMARYGRGFLAASSAAASMKIEDSMSGWLSPGASGHYDTSSSEDREKNDPGVCRKERRFPGYMNLGKVRPPRTADFMGLKVTQDDCDRTGARARLVSRPDEKRVPPSITRKR